MKEQAAAPEAKRTKDPPRSRSSCEKGEGDKVLWMRQEPYRKNYEK